MLTKKVPADFDLTEAFFNIRSKQSPWTATTAVAAMDFSFFLIVVFSTIFSSTASQKHQKSSDMVALMAFKNNSIHTDPNSFLRNWRMSSSVNPCSWNGVICSPDNQVTSLNLTNAGLIGSLRIDDLMVLESLQDVYLRGNSFSGSLANSSPSLPCKFKTIDLSSNNFSTPISNGFLSSCNHLSSLNLSNNRITGGIPGFIGNLKSLQELSLADNQFSGEIPFELGWTCGTLRELDLSGNQLSGGFPSSFNSCSSLQILNIGNNQLSGNVPYGFCSSSSSLQKLFLHSNVLSGFIPHEFGSCMNLTYIDLSLNSLSGSIPSQVWELPNLSNFVVWGNKLTGEIPQRICASSSKLETLIMNHNLITGTIPASLAKCTSLVWVSVSNNRLTGVIPHEIGNLKNLAILEMDNNSFTGDIPAEIGDCQSLIWLNLKHNHLTGFIPPQLANQAGLVMPRNFPLKKIAFIRNEGTENCEETGTLLYAENILTGRIADFIRRHSSCKSTRVYTLKSFYTFTENGTMIYLDLSYNSLEGSLPDGFGSMVYLQVLNLGHNRLTGTIPHSWEDLKEIGVLDLSHNYLKGFIPSSLGRLSFLSDLDLSNNKLEGTIPSIGQLSTFSASRYENNSGLCGIPLPPCNSAHYSPPEKLKQQHTEVGVIISIVLGYAVGFNIFAYVLIFKKSWRSVYFKYIEDRYNQLFLKKRR